MWPGMTRPTARGTITPQTSHLCELIEKVVRKALRAALPVWKLVPMVVYTEKEVSHQLDFCWKEIEFDLQQESTPWIIDIPLEAAPVCAQI